MPSAIDRHLTTLLPTKNAIPPQLTSLAASLLAQSKASAPKLKPQEEIAREYACAHIACERLLTKLALDLGPVLPPCAPRVYDKLHRYLDGILTAGKVGTPLNTPGRKAVTVTPTAKTPVISNGTPSKLSNGTPASLKRKRSVVEHEAVEVDLPEQLVKLGHHLSRSANLPAAGPHIYAGLERAYPAIDIAEPVEEVDTPNKRSRKLTTKAQSVLQKSNKLQLKEETVPLVVVAIAHQAVRRMKTMESVPTDADQELEMSISEALSFLREGDARHGLESTALPELVTQAKEIVAALQTLPFWQEWLSNVPILDNPDHAEADASVEADDDLRPAIAKASKTPLRRKEKHGDHDEERPGAAGLIPGLGTMFQPIFDWLSEERQEEYARWEKAVRQRIASVRAGA